MYARDCAKSFTCVNSPSPHTKPAVQELCSPTLTDDETLTHGVTSLTQGPTPRQKQRQNLTSASDSWAHTTIRIHFSKSHNSFVGSVLMSCSAVYSLGLPDHLSFRGTRSGHYLCTPQWPDFRAAPSQPSSSSLAH